MHDKTAVYYTQQNILIDGETFFLTIIGYYAQIES